MKKTVLRLFLAGTFTTFYLLSTAQNVGIGTGTPNYDLHIHNSAAKSVLQFTSGSTGSTSGDGFVVGQNTAAGEALIWNWENQDTEFGTNGAERMRIKADGKVGIGTSSPNFDLQIHNSSVPSDLQFTSASTGSGSFDGFIVGHGTAAGEAVIWNHENESIKFGTSNIERMRIAADGKVGIGTNTPSTTLHILSAFNTTELSITSLAAGPNVLSSYYNETAPSAIRGKLTATGDNDGAGVFGSATGTNSNYGIGGVFTGKWYGLVGAGQTGASAGIYADANGSTNALYVNGNLAGTGTYSYSSDARLKKNILPLEDALEAIVKMKPVEYEFKVGEFGSMSLPQGKHFGLIAQDLQKIYPQLVIENTFSADAKEGFRYLGVNYTELTTVLISGMQELNERLASEILILKTENENLTYRIEKLEALMVALKE